MANGGVRDIHITNEIVGARKLACLAELARHVDLSVCADNPSNVSELDAAASAAGTTLTVFVEVDVGNKRCGVSPGLAALALANQIVASPHLRFGGLQAYFGAAQHLRSAVERRSAATTAAEAARHTKSLLIASGIECPIVTGGGTGTWLLDAASETFDEIQPGSYVFMDADYARLELAEGSPGFEQSLFVWTTLMSHPSKEWGAVDAGLKALSTDSGMPPVHLRRGIEYTRAADEHGVLRFADPGGDLQVGEKLMLVPGHCDPTVNLHEWFVCFRKGKVEALWPITARGAFR